MAGEFVLKIASLEKQPESAAVIALYLHSSAVAFSALIRLPVRLKDMIVAEALRAPTWMLANTVGKVFAGVLTKRSQRWMVGSL